MGSRDEGVGLEVAGDEEGEGTTRIPSQSAEQCKTDRDRGPLATGEVTGGEKDKN